MSVHIQDQTTRPILLQREVRQGDVISPKLLTAALEDVFKHLTHLRFADDCLIGSSSYQPPSSDSAEHLLIEVSLNQSKILLGDFFKTYIRPRLTYAAPAWYALASEPNQKTLRTQQSSALRRIVNASRYIRNTTNQRDFLRIESIDKFIQTLSQHQQLQDAPC